MQSPWGLIKFYLSIYVSISPKKNTQYLVYKFRKATQHPGETLETYQTRLRILAKDCEFTNVDSEIIQSCTSSRLRIRALREPDMTLDDAQRRTQETHNVGTVEGNIHTQVTVQLRERSAKPVESKTTTPKCAAPVRECQHIKTRRKTMLTIGRGVQGR